MSRDAKDWNYDRITIARAQMRMVEDDLMRCLHKGDVPDVVQARMVMYLEGALADIKKLAAAQ